MSDYLVYYPNNLTKPETVQKDIKAKVVSFKPYIDQIEKIDELIPYQFLSRADIIRFVIRWSLKFFNDKSLPAHYSREIFSLSSTSVKITFGLLKEIDDFVKLQNKFGDELNRSEVIRRSIDLYFLNEDNRLLLCNNNIFCEEE